MFGSEGAGSAVKPESVPGYTGSGAKSPSREGGSASAEDGGSGGSDANYKVGALALAVALALGLGVKRLLRRG